MRKTTDPQIKLRLPLDLKQWIEAQALTNRCSQSSEIVRALRERQERVAAAQQKEPTL